MKTETMRPLTISLSPQQLARIQRAVDTGGYASNSEVLREALRLWEQREEMRELEIARLKQAYEEGLASGPPIDGEEAFSRIRAEIGGLKKSLPA
jgi:antitoxin ParD1/3/4